MRKYFADWLHKKMSVNDDIVLVTADLGYGLLDNIQRDYPNRFFNVGAAEQLLLGVGVGLSLEGKIPILYSISPFILLRPAEWIRNYLGNENIKCMLVGSGLEKDYAHDGFSHWLFDADAICNYLKIECFLPDDKNIENILNLALEREHSSFIGLRR